jgi:hypothetical protein
VGQEAYAALLKETKVGKPFLKALGEVGLVIAPEGETVRITSARFPAMLPALSALARACAQHQNPNVGRFNFARCDFRALDEGFIPSADDLFGVFEPAGYDRIMRLHRFFTDLGYRPMISIHDVNAWTVQYQGRSKIKGSPLMSVDYSPRYLIPLRVAIKCASTARILPLIEKQPYFLQEDFSRRVNPCNGDACGWCKDRKHLGPSVLEFDGKKRTVCWYTNPDVPELTEDAVMVIEQYARMHEELVEV